MIKVFRHKVFEHRTKDNDMVDLILLHYFGEVPPMMVELVIELNPFLADYDFKLPEGLIINIPIDKPVVLKQPLQLWG